jgi:phospholipid/cholesterol/gamma-HCH transport system ATP-binding protein
MDPVRGAVPPLIEMQGVTKRYDGKVVLDRVDLTIERGETCVLIGGSGSGKSTLARLLIALERPSAGHIFVGGVDLTTLSESELSRTRRRFAMVFQKYALLDSLTVFDNVAFPLREETDLSEDEVRERVHAALRELDVDDAASMLPGELSGGMAKRVGIARAVVTEPEILVYDEPTSGLDPVGSRVVDGLIERMRERHCVTSLVITHDMVTAYEVSDRVVLIAHGKIVAQGPPDQLFRSHSAEIEPFALSSGIDLERLAPRQGRKPPAEIRARWDAMHPPGRAEDQGWAWPWSKLRSA